MNDLVSVKRGDLNFLVAASLDLAALETVGIDNAEAYGEAEWASKEEVTTAVQGYIERANG